MAKKPLENFYITTAIDYANAKPHIGHALEKVQADAIARHNRTKGKAVWFLTGTDEHGTKIMRAAEAQNKDTKIFASEISDTFKNLKQTLNLSWDDFIRTTDKEKHWPGVIKLWKKLADSGDIYLKKYKGLYCVGHEAFVTERDLVGGICRDHQKKPEVIEEENYFFRLSKYIPEIKKKIVSGKLRVIPEARKNEILSLIDDLLAKDTVEQDVSFSRQRKDLPWGIQVPDDPNQTMYVWCDALSNYITAIGFGRDEKNFEKWWPADVHAIGKDILRFHALLWPGMLISAGLPLPKSIFVHGFITVEGQKMSKTIGNIIDSNELVKKYGTDAVRYYLLKELSPFEDGDFSVKRFEERYNGELANGLGNLVARVATIGEKLGTIMFSSKDVDRKIRDGVIKNFHAYDAMWEEFRFNEILMDIWRDMVSFGDRYINEKKPWQIKDEKELSKVILEASFIIVSIAGAIHPFLPETSEKIFEQFNFGEGRLEIKKGGILFPRLG